MKIVFFMPNPLTGFGGFKKVLSLLVNYLEETYAKVLICKLADIHETIPEKKAWFEFFQTHNTMVLRYSWPKFLSKRLARWLGEFRILNDSNTELLKDSDVVVVNFPMFLGSVSILLREIGFKGKIVGWFHSSIYGSDNALKTFAKRTLFKTFIAKQIKYADLILVVSSGIEKQVKDLLPDARVVTVYNPVLPADYEKRPPVKRSEKPIFVYVG